jgi:hypothetical protein
MVPWCSLADAKSNAGVKVADPPFGICYHGSFLSQNCPLTLCAAAIGHLTTALSFAAGAEMEARRRVHSTVALNCGID